MEEFMERTTLNPTSSSSAATAAASADNDPRANHLFAPPDTLLHPSDISHRILGLTGSGGFSSVSMSSASSSPQLVVSVEAILRGGSLELFVTVVVLGTVILSTIVGNAFVIAAIVLERNLRSHVANYLVASLAVADLMVAVLVMPLAALNEISSRWFLGRALCDVWTSFDVICCTSSILHLVSISADRYWAVTRLDYIHNRSARRILTMIAISWGGALLVSAPPLFFGSDSGSDPDSTGECIINQNLGYQVFSTVAAFYAPFALMMVIYLKVFRAARARIRMKRFRVGGTKKRAGSPAAVEEDETATTTRCAAAPLNHGSVTPTNGTDAAAAAVDGATGGLRGDGSQAVNGAVASLLTDSAQMSLSRKIVVPDTTSDVPLVNGELEKKLGDRRSTLDCVHRNTVLRRSFSDDVAAVSATLPPAVDFLQSAQRVCPLNQEPVDDQFNDVHGRRRQSATTLGSRSRHSITTSPVHAQRRRFASREELCQLQPTWKKTADSSSCVDLPVSRYQSVDVRSRSDRTPSVATAEISFPPPCVKHSSVSSVPCVTLTRHASTARLSSDYTLLVGVTTTSTRLTSTSRGAARTSPTSSPLLRHPDARRQQLVRSTECLQPPRLRKSAVRLLSTSNLHATLRSSWADLTRSFHAKTSTVTRPSVVTATSTAAGVGRPTREQTEQRRERKAARTLAIITGSFIFCWLPFFIVALLRPFCGDSCHYPPALISVIGWLGYVNSLLNPIIYTVFNPDFRSAFRKILFGKYRRRGGNAASTRCSRRNIKRQSR